MANPFTIRVFVPDGDPEGVRIVDQMNWTGVGLVFPRARWREVKKRDEFSRTGIYILHGYAEDEDDLPHLYIGQSDGVGTRIESHYKQKNFWDWGIVFVSTSGGLNRAHVTWLEHALVKLASQTGRCRLDNSNKPQEPVLTEAERADTQGFLNEVLQILPLVGLRAFQVAQPVATPRAGSGDPLPKRNSRQEDTIIVPAKHEGFESVFLGENCWYAIRISGGMLNRIKYVAAYQTQPLSAITHYALVDRIEPYGESGKYKLIFSQRAKPIKHIPLGDAWSGTLQGARYTTFKRLKAAEKVSDLFENS